MKNCYCPRCGGKQRYKLDDPSSMIQPCPICCRSIKFKMINGEMFVQVKPDKPPLKKATS